LSGGVSSEESPFSETPPADLQSSQSKHRPPH
jgi:hypothetical protein